MLKIALIQMSCQDEPKPNLTKALRLIDRAAEEGAKVVALQELFNLPYFPNRPRNRDYFSLAEPIPGPTTRRVAEKAREHGLLILAPVFEEAMKGVYYNSSALIGPDGEVLGKYRKTHIPFSDHMIEKFYFKPGDLGYPVVESPFGKIGVLICYDRHFPEGARALGLGGAELVLIPVASLRDTAKEAFEVELRGMAIANQFFVAAVNRVGVEAQDRFFGMSLVCDPRGNVIARAGDKDEVLLADIDLAQVAATRDSWLFYRDRRPETYTALTR